MKYKYPFKTSQTEDDLRNLVVNMSEAIYKKPCRFAKQELGLMRMGQLKGEIEALYHYAKYYSILKEEELLAIPCTAKEVK